MRIEITFARGDVDMISYDQNLLKKIQSFLETEHVSWNESEIRRLHVGISSVVRALEKFCSEEADQPFTVVLTVAGEADRSTGPRNY
ncbi:MAG: hypothetical protein AB7L09_01400 [Nitrospira sp.]